MVRGVPLLVRQMVSMPKLKQNFLCNVNDLLDHEIDGPCFLRRYSLLMAKSLIIASHVSFTCSRGSQTNKVFRNKVSRQSKPETAVAPKGMNPVYCKNCYITPIL